MANGNDNIILYFKVFRDPKKFCLIGLGAQKGFTVK